MHRYPSGYGLIGTWNRREFQTTRYLSDIAEILTQNQSGTLNSIIVTLRKYHSELQIKSTTQLSVRFSGNGVFCLVD